MNGENGVVATRYRVLYGDVDCMGVMYYANYLRLFERGRSEYVRDKGLSYKAMEDQGFILPVTETHCHYYRSARYDDLLLIETRVAEVKRASVRFDYEVFRDAENREKLADGYTLHACITPETKVVRLPDFMRSLLTEG